MTHTPLKIISLFVVVQLITACGGSGSGNGSTSVSTGEQLYVSKCQSCHGVNGIGGSNSDIQNVSAAFIVDRINQVPVMNGLANNSEASLISSFLASSTAWSWLDGYYAGSIPGNYGTKNVAHIDNQPGARQAAVTWVDNNGVFWLFGGYGADDLGTKGLLNDLWKYDGVMWTWVSGAKLINQTGFFIEANVPNIVNVPGSRTDATSWTDASGNFYVFGGSGYSTELSAASDLNDLWMFDGTSWTFISFGNSYNIDGSGKNLPGVYGNQGDANIANHPGSRHLAVSWLDENNVVWLYGGYGIDKFGNQGSLGDLWKYDGAQWTWMSGTTTVGTGGTWGVKGVTSTSLNTIKPSARLRATSWVDNAGTLWLFGGTGKDSDNISGYLNDLWKFEPNIGRWTWVSGSNIRSQAGTYDVKGAIGEPGSREKAMTWSDSEGNAWLFGGTGYDENGASGLLNDLWRWNGTNWTWIEGDKIVNIIGITGPTNPTPAMSPGSRNQSASWIDSSNNLWIFGGYGIDADSGFSIRNDVWRYKP